MKYRTEIDTMGEVRVPSDKLWGAQTQRSLMNFPIGSPSSMPVEIIYAFAQLKKAAALSNRDLGKLSQKKCELISRVCDEIVAGELDVHPNDDVNRSQSSNDTFPAAMHIAACTVLQQKTLPGLSLMRDALFEKEAQFEKIVKIGRTHWMDVTPLTLGQEFSGYVSLLDNGLAALKNTLEGFKINIFVGI